jgi:hypothetical protein
MLSSWAGFGWGSLGVPDFAYALFGLMAATALFGLLRLTWHQATGLGQLQQWQTMTLMAFGMAILLSVAQILFSMFNHADPAGYHGRSLLPVLLPVSALLTLGLQEAWPRRWRSAWPSVLLSALILSDAVSLALAIIPYFYG